MATVGTSVLELNDIIETLGNMICDIVPVPFEQTEKRRSLDWIKGLAEGSRRERERWERAQERAFAREARAPPAAAEAVGDDEFDDDLGAGADEE